jgi:uncharacterized protein (TIGR03437 family)
VVSQSEFQQFDWLKKRRKQLTPLLGYRDWHAIGRGAVTPRGRLVGERFQVSLIAECFNLFNIANLTIDVSCGHVAPRNARAPEINKLRLDAWKGLSQTSKQTVSVVTTSPIVSSARVVAPADVLSRTPTLLAPRHGKLAVGGIVMAFLGVVGVLLFRETNRPGTAAAQKIVELPPVTSTLRAHPTNGRYFTDDTGEPIYLTGSHVWYNLQDRGASSPPPVFDFTDYLDFLAAHNHNFIRLWRWEFPKSFASYAEPHPWKRTGPGTALDGQPKFDLTQLDQDYFDRLHARVIAAGDRGIYVSIVLFEGWALTGAPSSSRWAGHPMNSSNNINGIDGDPNSDNYGIEINTYPGPTGVNAIQKAYVERVIDTVNDLDNVLYEISNESGYYSKDWQYDMIDYIQTYESGKAKQHPVGMTYEWSALGIGPNSDLFDSDADWVSPGGSSYEDDMPAADATQVILLDTDHIFGVGGDRDWVWKAFTRGMNPIYMDPIQFGQPNSVDPRYGGQTSDIVGARAAMGDTRTYANKMADFAAMVPHEELSTTDYALVNRGEEYLVYQPGTGRFTVTTVAGTYTYEWFNPVTSTVTERGSVTVSSGDEDFTPPFSGTAVLYLRLGSAIGLSPPAVYDGGVVNAASFAPHPAPVAPGSIAVVFGNNLNDGTNAAARDFGPDGKLPIMLGGASVKINGTPVPLFSSIHTPSYDQLTVQIPFELAGQASATVEVTVAGQTTAPRTFFVDMAAPGIFTVNQQGTGGGVLTHLNGTAVSEQDPAHPNEVLIMYATGLGVLSPPLATGAPSAVNETAIPATVTVDGVFADVLFSGSTPGLVGLNQINLRIPQSTRSASNIPVVLSSGGKQSNTVTIAVAP